MRASLWLVLAGAVLGGGQARACSIPVFRYALERWPASLYQMHVFHRGPLSAEQKAIVARLEKPATPLNLEVRVVDLDGKPAGDALALWRKHPPAGRLPWVVLRRVDADSGQAPLYAGPLDDRVLARLVDSPGRRRVVELLARGVSAVWLLLESGDREADERAARLLRRELARLEKEIKLPEPTGDGPELLTELPLKVDFPIVRLDRRQADEDGFVRLLLASEEGLEKAKGPLAFPIFGRGRVLCGLEVGGSELEEVEERARFLCGACSCRVKELNPGTDLLLPADWDRLLDTDTEAAATPPAPAAPAIPAGKTASDPAAPAEPMSRRRWWLWGGLGAGAMLTLLFGAWALRGRQAARKT